MEKITHRDFEEILGFSLSSILKKRIDDFDLKYRQLTIEERDNYLLNVFNVLSRDLTKSGEHRLNEWEKGWRENLKDFTMSKNVKSLIPKYHGKNLIVRWKGDVIYPLIEDFDYKIHICFVDAILQKYLNGIKHVFEFGCGPAYHLVRFYNFNTDCVLNGCDWATSSQDAIIQINSILGLNINPINLNLFEPDYSIDIPENSGIFTIAAFEQIGDNFKAIVDFILAKKPKICINMEPIDELLDEMKLIDNLSIKYFRKRNYLNKFLPYLEELEKQGIVEIIKKQRIFSGSYFIEGHSLIIWKVK